MGEINANVVRVSSNGDNVDEHEAESGMKQWETELQSPGSVNRNPGRMRKSATKKAEK